MDKKRKAIILIPTGNKEREYFRRQAPGWEISFPGADLDRQSLQDFQAALDRNAPGLQVSQNENAPGLQPAQIDVDGSLFACNLTAQELEDRCRSASMEELLCAEVIIGNPPLDQISKSTALGLLQTSSAGVNAYAGFPEFPQQTKLCNCRGAYGLAVSEHMVGMLFELYKNLHFYRDEQSRSCWKDRGRVYSVEGSRIMILGLGDIGTGFGKRVSALGAHVTALRRHPGSCPDYLEAVYPMERLDELLPTADAVALCLPDSPSTRGLFDRSRLLRMKKDSVLLNVGRGTAVVADDLYEVIRSGHLLGAGLDVINPEPFPADHPLWKEPRVVITPHVSGLFHLPQTYQRMLAICGENLARYAKGLPLVNEIDPRTGRQKEQKS